MLHKFVMIVAMVFFTTISNAQNKKTTTITIKTEPYGGTTFSTFSNLNSPYNLEKVLFPVADKNGIWKIEYEIDEPIMINFLSRLLANNNFYFLAEKGYDYVISKDEFNPVHRVQNDSIFINEFNILNHLYEQFNLTGGPEISIDEVTYWEKGIIKYNTPGESDTAWKKHSKEFENTANDVWALDKPLKTEEQFFKACNEITRYRNYVLDSAFEKKLVSNRFYAYFKTFVKVWHVYNTSNIIPPRNYREMLNIPLSLDTNFSLKTRQLLKENDAQIVKLFKCNECIEVAGFASLIVDYLHKKLFNESKYRTIMEEIFEYVLNSQEFTPQVRNMILFTLIHHNKPIKNKVKNYPILLDKFYKACTDPYYINLLKSEINAKSFSLTSNDLSNTFLYNENGVKTNLKQVLDNNKGKYVYIDLWGSRYIASTNQLNNAKKLYDITKDKDFTVLFLGFEKNISEWKEKKAIYNLPKTHSFFCEKAFETPFAQALSITFLQRYVIFDKQGKLIEPNATWPDDILGKKYYDE